jgi:hypothetical protein
MFTGRRVLAAIGALAFITAASTDASAKVKARNDPGGGDRFEAVQGSKLRLRISSDLLDNDSATGRDKIQFRGAGDEGRGIANIRLSKNGKFLIVKLANNFEGNTSFRYTIRGSRSGDRDRAKVFLRVGADVSPN